MNLAVLERPFHPHGWWCNVPILKNDGVRQWEG